MTAREMEKRLLDLSTAYRASLLPGHRVALREEYRALHERWMGAK